MQEFGACRRRKGFEALAESFLHLLEGYGPILCSASKPYDKDDADGQQGAGEPERDECLAPVRAVAHRLEDPDADAPCVERRNERGDASKAERAESRRPGEGAPKHVATGRFKIPAHLLDPEYRHGEPGAKPDRGGRGVSRGDLRRNRSSSQSIRSSAKVRLSG